MSMSWFTALATGIRAAALLTRLLKSSNVAIVVEFLALLSIGSVSNISLALGVSIKLNSSSAASKRPNAASMVFFLVSSEWILAFICARR